MIKKNLFNNTLAFVIAAIVIFFISCQGSNKQGTQGQSVSDSADMKAISKDVKDVVYPLPTPFQTTRLLNNIGAGYTSAILNPVDKAKNYFTEKSKAINLGVYGADLAYAATYDQKQDVKLYSKVLKSLVEDLGINIDYSNMLSDEFKEKVNNKDSLIEIITRTYNESYKSLNGKGNESLTVLMVSGMWVELMYIATNISKDTYNNTEIVKLIAMQKDSYNKLMSLLEDHISNVEVKELHTKLLILQPIYDKVDKGLYQKDYMLILNTIRELRKTFVS